ncbi:putative cytochrome P450 CYP44 isoform X2 [Tubulanus polymorphus]
MKDPRVPPFINAILEFRKKNGYTHGLGFSVGDEWRRLRHNSQKYWLNAKNCHAYFDRMSAIADQFVGYISKNIDAKGEVPNLYPMMKIWNLESSAILAFDRSFGAFTDNPETSKIDQLISSNQLMFDMGSRFPFMLPLHDYFMTPMKKQLFRSEQIVYTIVKDLIEETLRKIKDCKNDAESSDKYLWLKHCLSRSELVKNDYNILTQNLLLDGLAGTAPQAANLIYRLAKSPDKQDKLFDEIKREVGPTENETRTSMSNMTYLKACLKEAARLTNVGTEVSRILTEDVELSGFRVLAGTRVDLNHFVTCRMEEYFDRPNEFLPERWLRDVNNTNGIHPYAHAQFGAGTRMCPGRLFARQDIELFAVKLLKKYRVEWHQPKNLKQDWKILFAPENNEVPITFEQR